MDEQLPAESAAGMGASEILLIETASVEQSDRQSVAERERGGGARRRRKIQRAGFLRDARVKVDIGFPGKRRVGIAGQRDQLRALAFYPGDDREQLIRLAGIRERQNDVIARDHAQIAVSRLGGVDEKSRRPRARQPGCDVSGDVPRLADAAHLAAPAAPQARTDRTQDPLAGSRYEPS